MKMDARVGDKTQKDMTLRICVDAGMEVKTTLGGDHVQVFDGGVLVVAIMRVSASVYAFRYNPQYWNGL